MPISDVRIIILIQRPYAEQDGHDEQVIVVKQICKCKTIAFSVMVCLWICKVIVPLQLGYLHNQLLVSCYYVPPPPPPLPICCSIFIAVGSLPYKPSLELHQLHEKCLFVLLCYIPFLNFTTISRLQVTGHVYISGTGQYIFILFVHCCTEQ